MWSRLRSFLHALMRRQPFEEGLAEEVRFHIEHYTNELVHAGVPREEAARRARLEFGSIDNVKADCREARGLRLFDELAHDVRYSVRLLRRTPLFTATALITLAICLGANLTIFAVVDSVLLRPLPFPDADGLVKVFNTYPKAAVPNDGVSLTNYYERRGRIRAFSSLAIYKEGTAVVGEPGATERERITRVSPEFFSTVGIGPVAGRAFTEAETTFQTDSVAIVTDAYWRHVLGADRNVIGRTLRVDGLAKTVVGVLPPEFSFLSSTSRLYLPLASDPDRRGPDKRHWGSQAEMIARLAPGVSVAEAQSQIDAHNAAMEGDGPEAAMMAAAGFRSIVAPLRAEHVAAIRPTLLILQAGALFLLLIGAVNVSNLLLIRASGRIKEVAVRQALGASRRHVVHEVLAETLLLTLVGGLLGLAAGAGGIPLLALLGAERLPLGAHIAFDGRLAVAAVIAAMVLGVAIGAPIAWYHLRRDSANALQSESRGSTAGRATRRMRHGFLVAQMALAFVLLAGAGLLALSLERVMALAPGFRPENVLSGQISLPWKNYQDRASRLVFTERLMDAIGRQPGVLAAGVVTNVPLSGNSSKSAATIEGRAQRPEDAPHAIYSYGVAGDYFKTLGFSLHEGRFLEPEDARRPGRVCVIDEDFARRNWPRGGAIGQRLFMGGRESPDAEAFTVIGIVGAVKQSALTDDERQGAVFYPYPYWDGSEIFVVARTSLPPESLGDTLQRVVRSVDPEVPVTDIRSMETRIADSLIPHRSPALLAGVFAGIALLLTAVGTFGVLSYAVSQRRREIGLRIALGARPDQVRRQFIALALRLLAAGTFLGIIGAYLTGRAMQTVLFQVPPLHTATLAGTAGIMAVVCLAACLLPSRRAAHTSPMEALSE